MHLFDTCVISYYSKGQKGSCGFDTCVISYYNVYLLHQQGHTLSEAYTAFYERQPDYIEKANEDSALTTTNGGLSFVESVVSEIDNNYIHGMTELTALTSASGKDILEVLDSIANKTESLVLSENTEIGLYNEWSGSGSSLEINLEKPAIFPADMVRNVQIEGAGKENDGYTVDNVYGLTGDTWTKTNVKTTSEKPVLIQENMKDTFAQIQEYKHDFDKEANGKEANTKENKSNTDRTDS